MEDTNSLNLIQAQSAMILPTVAVEKMKSEIQREFQALRAFIEEKMEEKEKAEAKNHWLESVEARKMLGVSQKTWQVYRDTRVIPFSQFGRKIYVRREDIEAFLQSNMQRKEQTTSPRGI